MRLNWSSILSQLTLIKGETTLMYIWIQLLIAMQLLSINYDENIILSWMKNSMWNAKQNFSTSILVP